MEEIWKPINGYKELYEVSNKGRVRSLKTGKEMARRVGYDGYVRVSLTKQGQQKQRFLHRLVATAFIENPYNLPEVNHKDEDKANNLPRNLEWCTHKYNSNYGSRLYRMAQTNSIPVIQYTKSGQEVARYSSIVEASEAVNDSGKHISNGMSELYRTATINLLKEAIKGDKQPQNGLKTPQR